MRKNITGIDHVVILVRDLDRASETYARMGLTLTPRGFHSIGSQNHCMMFGNDYIELLLPKPHPAMDAFVDFVAAGEGLGAISIATDDARALRADWAAGGVNAGEALDFSRPVEGLGEARFRIVQLDVPAAAGCQLFACQHFNRDLVWRREYQAHPLGVTGISAIAVVSGDARPYQDVLGSGPEETREGSRFATGSASVLVTDAQRLSAHLPGVSLPARAAPAVAALFLRVKDRAETRKTLLAGGFRLTELADGIAIGADQAHGVALVFR
jgi:catechol 2,3-dioxygenase-like lactoylglutathione lyase family enzyme